MSSIINIYIYSSISLPMPNKCTRCGKVHEDGAEYLIKGCDECGSKFFFYVREEALRRAEKDLKKLSKKQVREIEDDIRDIVPDSSKEETVVLDLEAIRVVSPGKYEIDVTNLFNQKPLIIRLAEGKYRLDLSTLLSRRHSR